MSLGVFHRHGCDGHLEVLPNHLGNVTDRHAFFSDRVISWLSTCEARRVSDLSDSNPRTSAPCRRHSVTAFAETEKKLRERCATVEFDTPSLTRKLGRCELSHCRGMCCYDGVYVDEDTGRVLETLAVVRAADFRDMGLDLPPQILEKDRWRPSGLVTDYRTALKPFPFAAAVDGYPAHFRQTACVFLIEDGRCGLQALAERDGRHPWFYKPIPCWLHPISVSETGVTVHDELTDPYRFPWYDGYVTRTFCGRTCPEGAPAAEVLSDELTLLRQILAGDSGAEDKANDG